MIPYREPRENGTRLVAPTGLFHPSERKLSSYLERTSRPQSQPTLLIGHVDHLHLVRRVLSTDPVLGRATLHPIYEFLKLVAIRHPPVFTGQVREFATGFLVGIGFVRLGFDPFLKRLAIRLVAGHIGVLYVDAMPDEGMNEAVQRHLSRQQLFLGGRERLIRDHDLPGRHPGLGGLPQSGTPQRSRGLAYAAVGEAEFGLKVVVALVVDAIAENTCVAGQTLLRLVIKDDAQHAEIVCTQHHHAAPGEVVIELDVIFGGYEPGDHGICVDVHDVRRVDEGSKQLEGRVKPLVKGFQQHWGVGLRQFGQVEQDVSFACVGDGRFLQ